MHVGRTVDVAVEHVLLWLTEPDRRSMWLPVEPRTQASAGRRTVRWTWPDGSAVRLELRRLAPGSTGLTVEHRLPATVRRAPEGQGGGASDAADGDALTAWWEERLAALDQLSAAPHPRGEHPRS